MKLYPLTKSKFSIIFFLLLLSLPLFLFIFHKAATPPPSLPIPGLKIRPGYSSYDSYIHHQLNKTLNPKLRKIWTTRDWDRKIRVFTEFFDHLKQKGLLSNSSKALCVGARMGQEVEALKRVGCVDSVGIDLVPSPPFGRAWGLPSPAVRRRDFRLRVLQRV
ncbi:UNVERIFIED_CONTAM: hypothetical protein Sangu_0523400 [Sesamum angustifolium]|uniref:Uncharacterized protein n=1 Tax=Sesamum angustifolium TaxID=2727405 RepID=A0AAW2Q959_9LAMI